MDGCQDVCQNILMSDEPMTNPSLFGRDIRACVGVTIDYSALMCPVLGELNDSVLRHATERVKILITYSVRLFRSREMWEKK